MPGINDWYITDVPTTLDDVYGQDHIVSYLKKNFKNRKFDKSIMLMGPFGLGKTVLAKIVAKALACKTPNSDGSGCGKCASCISVDKEQFNRDITYINAGIAKAEDVRITLEQNLLTPPLRDAAKVFLVDETQGLSKEALEAFLNATQSPLLNTYFIFTSMEKFTGATAIKGAALSSRCKVLKLNTPVPSTIYQYLAKFSQKKGLISDKEIPISFWKDGLKAISENSENSFRKAIQLLQQAYDSKSFEIEDLKKFLNFDANEDTNRFLIELSNGQITQNTLNMIMGTEYQDKFNLMLNLLGDAKTIRTFGHLFENEEERWREAGPLAVSKGKYFNILCDAFMKLSFQTYLKKGDFKILMMSVVEQIKKESGNEETPKVVRRKPV